MAARRLAALVLIAILLCPTAVGVENDALRLEAEIFDQQAPLRNATRPAQTSFAMMVALTAVQDIEGGAIIAVGISNVSGPDDRPIRVTDQQALSQHDIRLGQGRATVNNRLDANDTARVVWNGQLEQEAVGTTFDLIVQAAGRPRGSQNATRISLDVLSRFHIGNPAGLPGFGALAAVAGMGAALWVVGRRSQG